MRRIQTLCSVAALVLSACVAVPPKPNEDAITAQDMRAHMRFLADDRLEGREAGTRGYDIAAAYVAAQFAAAGLQPGGDGDTYFQHVPLLSYQRVDEGAGLTLHGPDGATALQFGVDYYADASASFKASDVSAPVVFAGFGVAAPRYGRDDYAGLDVEGKIVAVLTGAPQSFQSEERAHYSSGRTKAQEARARGAVGLLRIYTPVSEERFPFVRAAQSSGRARMTWRASDVDETENADGAEAETTPALKASAVLSLEGAEALFAHAPFSWEDTLEAAATEAAMFRTGPLNVSAQIRQSSDHTLTTSPNVVGVIPGSSHALRDELVVLTAHLDHIGLGPAFQEDRINNGALDNAAGVSALIEVAAAARDMSLGRTVVFVALTAEEKGLVGAEYFVNYPSVPGVMAANVNLDMPVLLYDFTDVIAFGAERSSLGPLVEQAVLDAGVALAPDPMPEQQLFTRSDHYRFVQKGVPSVFLMTGFSNGGREAFTEFLATRYHRFDDDLSAPIDYEAGAKFARVNFAIMKAIADTPLRPVWRQGDFFGTLYGGPMASP